MGGIVTHAVVKIANYTTNYDFVDITRVLNVYGLNGFYALCMRTDTMYIEIRALRNIG